jgi:metal-sulfur cluster biosynthetic enzyme
MDEHAQSGAAAAAEAAPSQPEPAAPAAIRDRVIEQLRGVYDPEIPVNIYELGLIYAVDVDAEGKV